MLAAQNIGFFVEFMGPGAELPADKALDLATGRAREGHAFVWETAAPGGEGERAVAMAAIVRELTRNVHIIRLHTARVCCYI